MPIKSSFSRYMVKPCLLLLTGLFGLVTATNSSSALPYQTHPPFPKTATRTAATYPATDIALTPGRTISELNFSWYTTSYKPGLVQIALKSAMRPPYFPVAFSRNFYCLVSATSSGYYSNKTVVRFLAPATEYVYRLGDGLGNWSPIYSYTTRHENQFGFLAMGDPQIGAGSTSADAAGWSNTMSKALKQFPAAAFVMTVGDQVETKDNPSHFAGFLAPAEFKSLPIAPALGNHDNGAHDYGFHFNLPNLSNLYGVTTPGSADYYFTYGKTLFMVLNSNNASGASHATFIRQTVEANPYVIWKIVMFHHDIYGSASHSTEASILNLRAALFPICDDYGIDIVITGHDHSYTRTYPLRGDLLRTEQTVAPNDTAVNPAGTVYLTLNSASGSKYYALKSIPESYAALRSQIMVPTFSYVSINRNQLTITTYRTDVMEPVDTYSIHKTFKKEGAGQLINNPGDHIGLKID
jgi:hypothetical protein